MVTVTQIDVQIPNRPGSLAQISDKLRAADVNISAINGIEGTPNCTLHLIVDDPETAKFVLQTQYKVGTTDVLAFKMKNTPGAIATIARACAAANINISNIYATSYGKEATVYVVVDDIEKARTHLKSWKKSFGSVIV